MYDHVYFFNGTKFTEKINILVVRCLYTDLRRQFLEIARKNSPEPRTVYSFMTTAIVCSLPIIIFLCLSILCVVVQDTRAMAATLAVIRTSIVYNNLQTAELLH